MKKELLKKISDENNGYLFTADVLHHGISKTYLAKFIKENGLENKKILLGLSGGIDSATLLDILSKNI